MLSRGRTEHAVKKNRETGTAIALRDFKDEPGSGKRWSLTCITHLTECSYDSRARAMRHLSEPSRWCAACAEIVERQREDER